MQTQLQAHVQPLPPARVHSRAQDIILNLQLGPEPLDSFVRRNGHSEARVSAHEPNYYAKNWWPGLFRKFWKNEAQNDLERNLPAQSIEMQNSPHSGIRRAPMRSYFQGSEAQHANNEIEELPELSDADVAHIQPMDSVKQWLEDEKEGKNIPILPMTKEQFDAEEKKLQEIKHTEKVDKIKKVLTTAGVLALGAGLYYLSIYIGNTYTDHKIPGKGLSKQA